MGKKASLPVTRTIPISWFDAARHKHAELISYFRETSQNCPSRESSGARVKQQHIMFSPIFSPQLAYSETKAWTQLSDDAAAFMTGG